MEPAGTVVAWKRKKVSMPSREIKEVEKKIRTNEKEKREKRK